MYTYTYIFTKHMDIMMSQVLVLLLYGSIKVELTGSATHTQITIAPKSIYYTNRICNVNSAQHLYGSKLKYWNVKIYIFQSFNFIIKGTTVKELFVKMKQKMTKIWQWNASFCAWCKTCETHLCLLYATQIIILSVSHFIHLEIDMPSLG